jgi:hypothetical protein
VDNWKNITHSQNSVRKKSFGGTFSFSNCHIIGLDNGSLVLIVFEDNDDKEATTMPPTSKTNITQCTWLLKNKHFSTNYLKNPFVISIKHISIMATFLSKLIIESFLPAHCASIRRGANKLS